MTVLFIIVFLTIFVSANCSLYEAVLYSTRIGTLEAAIKRKDGLAPLFIQLKKKMSTPIAAILITNTLANTAGATIAGFHASQVLNPVLLPIFSVFFTLGILFLSEIMPKNIGAAHWRGLWRWVVHPIRFLNLLLSPVIFITEKFSRLFIKGGKSATMTEDEILAMIHVGAREGEITEEESRMVHSMIDLENKTVRQVMTPRTIMYLKEVDSTLDNLLMADKDKVFTRIPVWKDDRENIIGYIDVRDLIVQFRGEANEFDISLFVRPISYVTDSTNCLKVLTDFLKHRKHIAVVVDEYGSVSGIVTLEDLIETLIGREIVDELDKNADLQKVALQLINEGICNRPTE